MTVVIAFDGSPEAEHAIRAAGELLIDREAIVVTIWKSGLGFELVAQPASSIGLPPAPIDVRTAAEIDRALYEGAQRTAQRGAELAREGRLYAEPLAVADDPDTPIQETIVQVARERQATAIVVGSHAKRGLLGDITRGVIKLAPCPVLVGGPPG
jgi:nucleotide-binding universal stress UspA family protein